MIRVILTLITFGAATLAPLSVSATTCCKCIEAEAPSDDICINFNEAAPGTVDCGALVLESSNAHVRNLECDTPLFESQCKPVIDGGVCVSGPTLEGAFVSKYTRTPEGEKSEPAPTLGVDIPNLDLGEAQPLGGGVIRIPWLARYISGVYRYLTVIGVVAAAVMIVYGGFRWIVGGTVGGIQRGKTIVFDALIGLVIILGAYTILSVVSLGTVTFRDPELQIVHRRDAFEDPVLERQRVEASATIKASRSQSNLVPVIYEQTLPLGDVQQTIIAPDEPQDTKTAGDVGDIAKDTQGNLIAQGLCPIDMVPILQSKTYTSKIKKVDSFCMDIFEAPNQQGEKPLLGANEWEAEWYCNERGKRLCTTSEWVRACTGPNAENTYGYGPEFIEGENVTAGNPPDHPQWYLTKKTGNPPAPCNYDSVPNSFITPNFTPLGNFAVFHTSPDPGQSILNPDNPNFDDPTYKKRYDAMIAEIERLRLDEPSGSRPCVTAEGVYDMSGNVAEMTVRDTVANLTTEQRVAMGAVTGNGKPYNWMGFYWAPIAHMATSQAKPTCQFGASTVGGGVGSVHPAGQHRDYANGFRCCLNLDP